MVRVSMVRLCAYIADFYLPSSTMHDQSCNGNYKQILNSHALHDAVCHFNT